MPTQVYSLDPAQIAVGTYGPAGNPFWSSPTWSHATLALTAEPYAIANGLPYNLAASFLMSAPDSQVATSNFFFMNTGLDNPQLSDQTFLVAWEHGEIALTVNALLASYYPSPLTPPILAPAWPVDDYDTIWTVKLDGSGNVTVNNAMCEGINSATLMATAPQF